MLQGTPVVKGPETSRSAQAEALGALGTVCLPPRAPAASPAGIPTLPPGDAPPRRGRAADARSQQQQQRGKATAARHLHVLHVPPPPRPGAEAGVPSARQPDGEQGQEGAARSGAAFTLSGSRVGKGSGGGGGRGRPFDRITAAPGVGGGAGLGSHLPAGRRRSVVPRAPSSRAPRRRGAVPRPAPRGATRNPAPEPGMSSALCSPPRPRFGCSSLRRSVDA